MTIIADGYLDLCSYDKILPEIPPGMIFQKKLPYEPSRSDLHYLIPDSVYYGG